MSRSLASLYPELADLASQSADQSTFRQAWMACVTDALRSDAATISSSDDGQVFTTDSYNGASFAEDRMPNYVAEVASSELQLMMSGAVSDERLWPMSRRRKMLVYEEYYCSPDAMRTHALRMWISHGTAFMMILGRRRQERVYDYEQLRVLERLVPLIQLGEALHRDPPAASSESAIDNIAAVTAAERRVAALAQRGLTTPEISLLTGTTAGTVRNQLSSAYRKLGVANRTELSFLLSGLDRDLKRVRGVPRSAIEKLLADRA